MRPRVLSRTLRFKLGRQRNRETGVPHFDSKGVIERHLEATGMPYTIVAPERIVDDWLY